jgi:Ca2+:H+ antiporter
MDKMFFGLLIFVPLSIAAAAVGASGVIIFFLAAVAVIPLAKYIGDAVEALATRTTPAVGGLLSSTFGNAPELIIGFFALRAGLFEVVKASITGSIISNLLLVLGMAMLAGGLKRDKQTFNRTAVNLLSIIVSVALLFVYGATLLFSLRTHKHLYTSKVEKFEPSMSASRAFLQLLVATLAVAWVSDILVNSIQPLVLSLGWSQLFVGVVFVAIIGNAAENFAAVMVARKDRMDLSLQIAIGSATQIAMVVAPVLVLGSFFLRTPMNLVFNTFELVSIVLSVLIVNLVVADGESNWLEGAQLLTAYAITAVAFFFHP